MVVMGEGDINDCWSLLAVVNESCRKAKLRAQLVVDDNTLKTAAAATATATTTTTPQLDYIEMDHSYCHKSFFDDQFIPMNKSGGFLLPSSAAGAVTSAPAADVSNSDDELKKLCGSFLVPYQPPVECNAKAEPVVVYGGRASNLFVDQNSRQQLRPRNFQIIPNQSPFAAVYGGRPCNYKKKKFEDRRMVRLTMEELSSSDKWAWRKYGQKPIKGSPYPRNYYKCSSIKGCSARKQVERSPIDPNLYIVTYTNHHHHPCPSIRNNPGPRVRIAAKSEPNPPPELESPTNTVFGPRYEPGPVGTNGVIKIDEPVAGDDNSISSGEMNEGYYNDAEILTPMNSMTYSELLTGMEQLNGEGNSAGNNTTTNNYYYSYYNDNNNAGYNRGCDPNVKMGVQMEENGLGYSIGIREMYASAPGTLAGAHQPPNNMGQISHNIWDNGMIQSQGFFS